MTGLLLQHPVPFVIVGEFNARLFFFGSSPSPPPQQNPLQNKHCAQSSHGAGYAGGAHGDRDAEAAHQWGHLSIVSAWAWRGACEGWTCSWGSRAAWRGAHAHGVAHMRVHKDSNEKSGMSPFR